MRYNVGFFSFPKYLSTGSEYPSMIIGDADLEGKQVVSVNYLSKNPVLDVSFFFLMYPSVVAESCDGESWPGLLRNIVLAGNGN